MRRARFKVPIHDLEGFCSLRRLLCRSIGKGKPSVRPTESCSFPTILSRSNTSKGLRGEFSSSTESLYLSQALNLPSTKALLVTAFRI